MNGDYSTSPALTEMFAASMKEGPNYAFGFRLAHADGDRVELSWTIDDRHLQPYGIVHGGVYCAVVETAGSIGAGLWYGDEGHVVGIANHTDFLRPAALGANLTANALPLHRGRTQQLWEVRVQDESARLVARGQLRLQNISHPGGEPSMR